MDDIFGGALARFRDVIADQLAGYRRLLETTQAGTEALRIRDLERFDRILEEQVDTLRRLRKLDRERGQLVRVVGGLADAHRSEMRNGLRALVSEVQRAGRVERLVPQEETSAGESPRTERRTRSGEATARCRDTS